MSTKIVQVKPLTLSSNIGTSNTTAIVSGMIGLDGVDLTQTDFGTIIYGTFEPNTTREEAVSFTITSNIAGVANIDFGVSGRGRIGKSPYGTGGIPWAHSAGAELVISNNPDLLNKFTAKDNNEVVTGAWEFPTPTTNPNPATKGYVDTEITATEGLVTAEAGTRAAADTALDNAMVKVTTDQTVAGVKTFVSSPIVPTATTSTQAVNKSQVEAYIAANSGDIKASDSAFGTVKLNEPADNIAEPKVVAATTRTQNFISAITGMITMYGSATPPTGFLLCNGQAVSRTTYAALFAVLSTSYGVGDGSTTFNVPDLRSSFPVGYGQKTKAFTFLDAAVNTGTDVITVTSNQFLYTGQSVALTTSGVLPAGLSATTYYVIYVSDTTIKLATSRANADDGTAVDITAAAGGGTHTLTLTFTDRSMGEEGGEESHTLQTEEIASHTHNHATYTGSAGSNNKPSETGQVTFNGYVGTGLNGPTGNDTPHNNMPPFVTVNFIIKT